MTRATLLQQASWLLGVPEAVARAQGAAVRGRISVASGGVASPARSRRQSIEADGTASLLPNQCNASFAKQLNDAIVCARRSCHRLTYFSTGGTSLHHINGGGSSLWQSLDDANSDLLPALALFQRLQKTAESLSHQLGAKSGSVCCSLLLACSQQDPRDAASSAADALRGLCEAITAANAALASLSATTGSYVDDPVLGLLSVEEPACQDCLLVLAAFALACLHRCSRAHPESCRREAIAIFQHVRALPGFDSDGGDAAAAAAGALAQAPRAPGGGGRVRRSSAGPGAAPYLPANFSRIIQQVRQEPTRGGLCMACGLLPGQLPPRSGQQAGCPPAAYPHAPVTPTCPPTPKPAVPHAHTRSVLPRHRPPPLWSAVCSRTAAQLPRQRQSRMLPPPPPPPRCQLCTCGLRWRPPTAWSQRRCGRAAAWRQRSWSPAAAVAPAPLSRL